MKYDRRFWTIMAILGTAALILLWADHKPHLISALPFLVLLACPLMHVFMHHGHGAGDHHRKPEDP